MTTTFMKWIALSLFFILAGCQSQAPQNSAGQGVSLTQARNGFKTVLTAPVRAKEPAETAPPNIFRTIKYPAPVGELTAYLSPDPGNGKKHPAIIWITGGDCNSIGDVWSPASPDNDQTAAAYRKAGIVMMFPSLRGGNDNPGTKEGFLGEVDDVLAAAKYLEKQPYVDAKRIYLGGHSTGGTLVLLVAQATNRFRAVFSFGPVEDVAGYGTDSGFLPFDISNQKEVELRSPGYWMASVQSPVWIIEGVNDGNIDSLRAMKNSSPNAKTHFVEVQGADHFTVLAPANELIAQKILQDTGATSNLALSEAEVNARFGR
jgi:dipeptidyl aminopeptidase/acylaminoacyl peptidase